MLMMDDGVMLFEDVRSTTALADISQVYQFNSSFVTPQKLHALCDDTKVHKKIYFKL